MNDQPNTNDDLWGAVQSKPSPYAIRLSCDDKIVRTVLLDPEVTYIGRMAENHIVIDDPNVSRSHARIMAKGGEFVIEDQESQNGLFVNDRKVKKHKIAVGDKIHVGSYLLEVIPAGLESRPAMREKQLDLSDSEEWRDDQTIAISKDQLQDLQKAYQAQATAKKEKQSGQLPSMSFNLKIGEAEFQENVTFDKGRKREPDDTKGNMVELRIRFGRWILEKRVLL